MSIIVIEADKEFMDVFREVMVVFPGAQCVWEFGLSRMVVRTDGDEESATYTFDHRGLVWKHKGVTI